VTAAAEIKRIEPEFYAKIWGSKNTAPWFDWRGNGSPDPLGEVWFPANDLLIKFLFTSQDLSVQVHPGDDYARRVENSRGKTEMWHILRAEPEARIALGTKPHVDRLAVERATSDGTLPDLLNWIRVRPGETYFVPAGTIHAIGGGIVLCEVQQNSDVTYRLYDYNRGRELHLERAMDVLQTATRVAMPPGKEDRGVQLVVECPYFATYTGFVRENREIAQGLGTRLIAVCGGEGRINGLNAREGEVFSKSGEGSTPDLWHIEPKARSGPMKLLLIR